VLDGLSKVSINPVGAGPQTEQEQQEKKWNNFSKFHEKLIGWAGQAAMLKFPSSQVQVF
jgi:hypothetical protein